MIVVVVIDPCNTIALQCNAIRVKIRWARTFAMLSMLGYVKSDLSQVRVFKD